MVRAGKLAYWICEKCRRRYDLFEPIPFNQLEKECKRFGLDFECTPCRKTYTYEQIVKQAQEIQVSQLSDQEKIVVKIDHVAEMLHNIQDTLVRLERAVDDLSRR